MLQLNLFYIILSSVFLPLYWLRKTLSFIQPPQTSLTAFLSLCQTREKLHVMNSGRKKEATVKTLASQQEFRVLQWRHVR